MTPAGTQPDSKAGIATLMLLVAAVLWSISGVAVKLVKIEPVPFAFWRSVGAAAFMLAVCWMFRGRWPAAKWMIPSAAIYTAVVGLLITSMTLSTAAAGILLQYTAPLWCAIFAAALTHHRISKGTWVAMVLAGAGISVMLAGDYRAGEWAGPTAGLISGVCFGGLVVLLSEMERRSGTRINPASIVLVNNAGAAVLLAGVAVLVGQQLGVGWQKALIVMAVGVVQLGTPYVLFQIALRHVSPVRASLITLLEPVLNPVWVAWLAGEIPSTPTLVGGAIILVAMAVEIGRKKAD